MRGYSLVELMVCLVVTGALAAISIPMRIAFVLLLAVSGALAQNDAPRHSLSAGCPPEAPTPAR